MSHKFVKLYYALNLGQSSVLAPGLEETCPIVMVTCSVENIPSTVLRWFFDDTTFAIHTFRSSENYPLSVSPENETFNDIVGGVHIQILSASHNESNLDVASFQSVLTANFSALQKAQVSEISCGTFMLRDNLAVTYNPNNGIFF